MAGCRMGRWSPIWRARSASCTKWAGRWCVLVVSCQCVVWLAVVGKRGGGRRFRVALLPTEIPASREPGLWLNPQLWRIPAEMRAELTSAEFAMSGSYFDDVLRDPRR